MAMAAFRLPTRRSNARDNLLLRRRAPEGMVAAGCSPLRGCESLDLARRFPERWVEGVGCLSAFSPSWGWESSPLWARRRSRCRRRRRVRMMA
ncbi:hypothetical protein TIFTF001_017379 [Ficus carica]|uniref:Uncharacterized protein n=1 Tax=Ficus carica TaxID=3494 RepID=A0AA88A4W0_FICCA|nr:hypothetical protein TIFTF001_017379 [Ficus carica]